MKTKQHLCLLLLACAAALPIRAAEIQINDLSQTPTADASQQTDISTPNGGPVTPSTDGSLSYLVTTFTFGANSQAHLEVFFEFTGGQDRLGVRVQDTGLVDISNQGDTGDTNFTLSGGGTAGFMAGQTVTLIARSYYHSSNDSLRSTLGTSDDMLMNVWVNPDGSTPAPADPVAGNASMLDDGDLHALWNSNTYGFLTQEILNQGTAGGSGSNLITNTTVLTGTDATWAKAIELATGVAPVADADTSTVSASPAAVPADDSTTSTITVALKDAASNPVASKEVALSGDGSATISTSDNISDSNGEVVFTVKSAVIGAEVFTATVVTDDNLVITDTASVDFQEVIPVGPVDAGNSSVVADPTSVIANGVSASTITVTLRDGNGQLVVGEDVTLEASPAGSTISPAATQTTDANGEASFSVSSGTIGLVVFTATSVTDNTTVAQTASVDFTDPQDAESFNVNFLDEDQADATGLVGVIGEAGEFWNQGTTSLSNLIDTTGTVVSTVSVSGLGSDGRKIPSAGLKVFDGVRNFTGKGIDTTISITGLTPDAPYDLYIYALSHNTGSWEDITSTERGAGDFVTSNTVLGGNQSPTQWLDNAVGGTDADAFIPNGNYVVYESIVADGSGNISVLVDAYDGVDGNTGTQDGDTRMHVNGLQIRPASGMSVDYMNWRSQYPGLGLPKEDDDGDAFSNDYERIFGLDPTDASSVFPYPQLVDPASGQFSYTRRAQALANLNYKVWVSTDLDAWVEDNAASQRVQSTTNGVELVDVALDPALLGEPKLFVQVRTSTITGIDLEPQLFNIRGSGNTMTLLFSEAMNASSAGNPNNYTVTEDGLGALTITDATVSADGGSVTLTFAETLGVNTDYTVDVEGVTSGTGQTLVGATNQAFRTWDDAPSGIKVFILAGQSNMVGRGESERGFGDVPGAIGSLRYQVVNDSANYGMLVEDTGNPATDEWVTRSDVNFWWNRADLGAGDAISKGGLHPEGFGSGPTTFGPEFGFGWMVGDFYDEPVLLIKTAWGGKDLARQFRSPSAVAKRGGVVGAYYLQMIGQVRQILENLDTQFPAAEYPEFNAAGYRYQIAGFGWHQGWNDSLNATDSNEYEDNMADFITDVRALFDQSDLPFAIGTTGMEGDATSGNRLTVVNAQIDVSNPALHPELGGNVFTVDTRPFARSVEESPTNDTTHWKNNGESMWLIGKGMGDGMVDLLAP